MKKIKVIMRMKKMMIMITKMKKTTTIEMKDQLEKVVKNLVKIT